MSLNLNKVIIAGRMVADAEIKQTAGGKAATTFRLAVNRRALNRENPEVDFFNVTAWQNTAEFIAKYFRKGSSICIIGRIQNRSWTDQNGQKRYATDIIADEAHFVENKPATTTDVQAIPAPVNPASPPPNFEEIETDEDLPF